MADPITLRNVRFGYCSLFQLNQNGKYSVRILLPKSNTEAKALLDAARARAIEEGVNQKWGGQRPPVMADFLHDGDGPRPSDGAPYGEECHGCWVFEASTKRKPRVVDRNVQDILDPTQVYSGMWGNVSVNIYPYNNNNIKKGIACGLNHVQKVNDGDPISGGITAEEAFKPVTNEAPATGSSGGVDPITGAPLPLGF